ncbi:hypothetical protein A8L34_07785 [Bacillus sp. FJAT-27264]|uniref:HesB/IscA family protein n=1 Tax=Paenibacillus sp. (strain DSM 101736 / FJAT-27264) TaxID=1850362 RepID=UPI000807CC50|nr:iron-sulfur cluster assembly accessory protein [Bacillus sp. FJAT-27264]OBZ19394.1 hypothetical protein A8L34_07785 [Bacillus sp. FJAT-27264]
MIEVSEEAQLAIQQMIQENEGSNLFLRVGIEDGGCSGLSYSLKLDDELSGEDEVLQYERFNVAWDKRSIEFLEGIKIDYKNQGMVGGFTIDNPNARTTCGCGASFRTATYRGKSQKCD